VGYESTTKLFTVYSSNTATTFSVSATAMKAVASQGVVYLGNVANAPSTANGVKLTSALADVSFVSRLLTSTEISIFLSVMNYSKIT
jgi:hypothetical protein